MNQSGIKGFLVSLWEILEVVVIATLTVFVIRTFLIQPFVVSGASMEPNFSEKDYLLVDEITYRFREPARDEVVVFRYTKGNAFFIKRIIGLPFEHVISDHGHITVIKDGKEIPVKEPYLPDGIGSTDSFDVTLAANQYFVLGDNRTHSFDSRSFGVVERDVLVGLVRVRIFPFARFEFFSTART